MAPNAPNAGYAHSELHQDSYVGGGVSQPGQMQGAGVGGKFQFKFAKWVNLDSAAYMCV
jgi:hypothetical protein